MEGENDEKIVEDVLQVLRNIFDDKRTTTRSAVRVPNPLKVFLSRFLLSGKDLGYLHALGTRSLFLRIVFLRSNWIRW